MKLRTQRIRLNSMGYDSHGRYYGVGAPLYRVYTDDEAIDDIVRATGSADARRKVAVRRGLRTLTAKERGKHPILGQVERLRWTLNEFRGSSGRPSADEALRLLQMAKRMASRVRELNSTDVAWRYADQDLVDARGYLNRRLGSLPPLERDVRFALDSLNKALQSIEGIASRIHTSPPTASDVRRRSRRPTQRRR